MTWRPAKATLFLEKTAAPTVNDDQNEGYLVGDIWLDETGDEIYECIDVTVGVAVWRKLSGNDPTLSDVDYIDFNTGLESGVAFREGRVFWDEAAKTLACKTESSDVTLQIGQEQHVRCTNKSGGDINNSQLVYNDGALGHKPTIALADASTIVTENGIGFATEDIADNATGYVTTFGLVRDVNTSGAAAGDILWLSSTPGGWTTTRPTSPIAQVRVGYCLYSHATEGIVFCHIHAIPRLRELCDVYSPTIPSDKAMLAWNTGNARFQIIGQGDLDHGSISGLGDSADHAYALLITGARPLTGDWDIGDGRKLSGDKIAARNGAGLRLEDDGGNLGVFVADGGNVNLKNGTAINEFSTDATLAGDSDDAAPTEKATKTYADLKVPKSDYSAKGKILVGTGSGTYESLTVGDNNKVLTADSAQSSGVKWATNKPYVMVSDTKTADTHGGTFTSGAWQTRTLNTEDSDTEGICSLSSNQITLSAGTYECRISAPCVAGDQHKAGLHNVTDNVAVLIGTSEYASSTYYGATRSFISGKFTIAASKALEVRHRCTTTYTNEGFGTASLFAVSEVYTIAEFWKVG